MSGDVEKKSEHEAGSVKIKLKTPVVMGSIRVEEVILRKPKGKHLRKLSPSPTLNDLLIIASKISGVESAIFDEMDSKDVVKIAEAVGELL